MLKLSIAATAVVLTGCASTGSWRALQIDASDESNIEASVAIMQQALPPAHRARFDMVLTDLWITGNLAAQAAGVEYQAREYFALLDGLRYEDVIKLAGPATTPRYWAVVQARGSSRAAVAASGLSVQPDTQQFGRNGLPVPEPGAAWSGWPMGANDRGGAQYSR